MRRIQAVACCEKILLWRRRGKDFAAFFRKHPDKILAGINRSGAQHLAWRLRMSLRVRTPSNIASDRSNCCTLLGQDPVASHQHAVNTLILNRSVTAMVSSEQVPRGRTASGR